MIKKINSLIKEIRKTKPLIHCITNNVVTDFNANSLLAIGALPIMAYAKEEVEEMAEKSNALYLNIGTLSKELIDNMILAGKSANKHNIPVILDPVGAGATKFRLNEVLRILKEVKISVVKGNPGEIQSILYSKSNMRGVESGETNISPKELCIEFSKKYNTICAITGPCDYISNGEIICKIEDNGAFLLNSTVGTGCTAGALIGAFLAVSDSFSSAVGGLALINESGYIAMEKSGLNPGTFKVELINAMHHVDKIENCKLIMKNC